jgi:type IV pilus assembly protein PilQ
MRGATLLALLLCAAPLAAQEVAAVPPAQQAPPPAVPPTEPAPTEPAADGQGASAPAEARPQPAPGSPFSWGDAGHLEFHARNLPVADVFAELRRLVRRNIIVAPEVNATFTGDLYDVTVDQIVDAICRSTNLVAAPQASYIYIEPDKAETRVYTLRHSRADDVISMIRPLLSTSGQVSGTPASKQGIPSSQETAGGDDYAASELVVVRDFATRLAEVDKVVASLDAVPRQVLIEATILAVLLNDDMQMGVELQGLLGADFVDAGAFSPDGQSLSYGGFGAGQLQDGLAAGDTNVNELIGDGGLNVGIFKDSVAVFVRALQAITDTTVLANPRVVTMNKQRGEVLLGRRDGFLTTTVTETSTTQSVEYLETGTRLIFRPYISGDQLVRLEIHPEDSNGGVNDEGLPFKTTAEVTTNVMVRSGQTVVIGGLFRTRDSTVVTKVPLLGDIPLLGQLFRSDDIQKLREEIIIVLTPHILDPGNADAFRGAGLDAEPLRDEVRKRAGFQTNPDKSLRLDSQDGSSGDAPRVKTENLASVWREALRRLAQTPGPTARVVLRGLRLAGGEDAEMAALRRQLDEPLPACEGLALLDAQILAAHGVGRPDVAAAPAPPVKKTVDAGPQDEASELWTELFGDDR